jgi:hypothetical protein
MALSRGVVTALVHTSALAPVYFAVTITLGGTISGNCVTGKVNRASTPNKVIKMEITSESMGLRIKVSTIYRGIKSPPGNNSRAG